MYLIFYSDHSLQYSELVLKGHFVKIKAIILQQRHCVYKEKMVYYFLQVICTILVYKTS